MSVSPQSLAKTRDKRSHKVPARFTDTVLGNLKDVVEVQPTRTSNRHRPGSTGEKREHEYDVEDMEKKEEARVLKAIKMASRPVTVNHKKQVKSGSLNETTVAPVRPLVEHVDPNSPSTPPPSTTPSPSISADVASTQQQSYKTHLKPPNISRSEWQHLMKSPSPPSKKKSSKGISLIVRPDAIKDVASKPSNTPKQTSTATISGVSNFNIHRTSNPIQPPNATSIVVQNAAISTPTAPTVQMPASAPTPVPPARYFNNLTTNQQHGTRLLINEPIYLPKSVATIAPITATLDQIASRARKAPFISKRAEACLAYQDQRKLNYITSNFEALVKITRFLGVRDRLNLRCVNRTWKSVIDCDSVWKEVRVDKNDTDLDLHLLTSMYLIPHKTTDIIFDSFDPFVEGQPVMYEGKLKFNAGSPEQVNDAIYHFGVNLPWRVLSLERIFIRSVKGKENNAALNLLACISLGMHKPDFIREKSLKCDWEVKVAVDDYGIATVRFADGVFIIFQTRFRCKIFEEHPCCDLLLTIKMLKDYPSIELNELQDMYMRSSNRHNTYDFEINVKPI